MTLLSICLGFFMTILDITIVNIALPNLKNSFSEGITGLQWIIDAYTLTFSSFLLVAGYFADFFGAKRIFLWGVASFALISLLCGSVTSIELLILFRLLQGIAAALIVPSSLALISAVYVEKGQVAKAIGIWAGVGGIAASSGIILGALLISFFGWRSIFLINLPVGIATFALALKFIPHLFQKRPTQPAFDWTGQGIGLVATASLAYALIESGKSGIQWTQIWIAFLVFVLGLMLYIKTENKKKNPMIPLKMFKNGPFSIPVFIGMALNISFYGILFILPLYLTEVIHDSILKAGLILLPLTVWSILTSYLSGKVTSKIGPKIPMLIGLLIASAGYLSLLALKGEQPPYFVFLLQLSLICIGHSVTLPAATASVIHAAPMEESGVAASVLNLSRQIGSLIGVALFGTIISRSATFVVGMHYAFLIAAAVLLFGAFFTSTLSAPKTH